MKTKIKGREISVWKRFRWWVVETTDNRWVVGMLKRRDAIAAYNKEVIRRGISERSAPVRLD